MLGIRKCIRFRFSEIFVSRPTSCRSTTCRSSPWTISTAGKSFYGWSTTATYFANDSQVFVYIRFDIRFECPSIININFLCSYLRLYTTMPVAKMAAFLEMPDTDFRTHLLCFKHKMKNVVWTKGTSGLDGELQSGSEVKYLIIIVLVECVSYLRFHRFWSH
jgi:hypothetical protein